MPDDHADVLRRHGFERDPVIDAYKPGVDVSRLIANRRLSIQERMDLLVELQRLHAEALRAGQDLRAPR